jgi:hypothetical protein
MEDIIIKRFGHLVRMAHDQLAARGYNTKHWIQPKRKTTGAIDRRSVRNLSKTRDDNNRGHTPYQRKMFASSFDV